MNSLLRLSLIFVLALGGCKQEKCHDDDCDDSSGCFDDNGEAVPCG